jgi:hypothetical protein
MLHGVPKSCRLLLASLLCRAYVRVEERAPQAIHVYQGTSRGQREALAPRMRWSNSYTERAYGSVLCELLITLLTNKQSCAGTSLSEQYCKQSNNSSPIKACPLEEEQVRAQLPSRVWLPLLRGHRQCTSSSSSGFHSIARGPAAPSSWHAILMFVYVHR